ncbi:hypothetical protein [Mesorhizobium sp. KR9-304]|uniref:hypothetical protein n=1 Tax=Mesorhizobium sp. KR9-304 TaxID=3156614 RepID=UPI0032B3771C
MRHLVERTLAAWLLAGTKRFPAYAFPQVAGSFATLLDVYRQLGIPEDVLEVARLASTRTQEGHPLTIPLIWLASSAGPVTIAPTAVPQPFLIGGWPEFAFDGHCRLGRRALSLFTDRCTALRQMMQRHLPIKAHADLVGHIVFRAEGHLVDRRISYPGSGTILGEAEVAHLTYSGFPANLVTDVLAIFGDNLDLLLQCRIEAVGGRA